MKTDLPQNVAAEAALLGAVIIDPLALDEIPTQLGAGDFYIHRNGWVWEAVQKLSRAGQVIDVVTLAAELERAGRLAELGGTAYLAKLIEDVPSALHAPAYAAAVAQAAERRELLRLAHRIGQAAYDPGVDLAALRSEIVCRLVAGQKITGGARPIGEVLDELYEDLKAAVANPQDVFGIPTGFSDFDRITAGIHQGEVLYLAGEPGMGKSLLAAQMAAQMAAAGHPGAIYELEMGDKQLTRRNISALSGVTTKAMRSGHVADHEWPLLVNAFSQAHDWPIHISDYTGWNTTSLRADLARLVQTAGIRWFVLDYFGLLQDTYGANEIERETAMSGAVKRICKDLSLAGIVVHSMNKTGMAAGVKRLEHISGAGRLAFDADVVCFLTKHIPADGQTEDRRLRTITFAKYREDESNRLLHLVKRPGLPAFGDYVPDPNASVKAAVRGGNGVKA